MPKVYKTARGEVVDLDMLRLANESVIAIGNMKTNARGDELGPGGRVIKTRAQIMQEYHRVHAPLADNELPARAVSSRIETQIVAEEPADAADMVEESTLPSVTAEPPAYTKPRGSFADAVAKQTEVKQEITNPVLEKRAAQKKVQRI
jgi:hypothetical protein